MRVSDRIIPPSEVLEVEVLEERHAAAKVHHIAHPEDVHALEVNLQ